MIKRIAVVLVSIVFVAPLFASATGTSEEKYRRATRLLFGGNVNLEDRDNARNLLESAARDGFAPAQTALATTLENGTLGTQDAGAAIDLYVKAANQGDWIAQLSLGRIFFYGTGAARDLSAARKWFLQAASAQDAISTYYLGRLSDDGSDAPDYKEAAIWYRRSAEAGNPFAQERLGRLWLKGLIGAGTREEAYAWLLVAIQFGNSGAVGPLQSMESDLGKAGSDRARHEAQEIYERVSATRAATCGVWEGQFTDSPKPPPLSLQPICEGVDNHGRQR